MVGTDYLGPVQLLSEQYAGSLFGNLNGYSGEISQGWLYDLLKSRTKTRL